MLKPLEVTSENVRVWNENAEKYKCATIHIASLSLYLCILKLACILTVIIIWPNYYISIINGNIPANYLIQPYCPIDENECFLPIISTIVIFQLIFLILTIFAIITEKSIFLIIYLIIIIIDLIFRFGQMICDFFNFNLQPSQFSMINNNNILFQNNNQVFIDLFGIIIALIYISTIYRCYSFINEKKKANQSNIELITYHNGGEQVYATTTTTNTSHNDQPIPPPPAYSSTSPAVIPNNSIEHSYENNIMK